MSERAYTAEKAEVPRESARPAESYLCSDSSAAYGSAALHTALTTA